jgi:hypothetical protein
MSPPNLRTQRGAGVIFSQPSPIIIESSLMNTFSLPISLPLKYRNCAPKHIPATEVSDHFELIRDPGDRDTVRTLVESRQHQWHNAAFSGHRVRDMSMQDAGAFLINLGILSSSFVAGCVSPRGRSSSSALSVPEHLPVGWCCTVQGCRTFLVRKFATVQAIDLGIVDEYVQGNGSVGARRS